MRRTTILLAVLGLALAACTTDERAVTTGAPETTAAPTTAAPRTTAAPETTTTAAETTTTAAAAEATAVELAETDLGPILVGAEGLTLYMFAPDEQGASTCYEQCAVNWPPLVGEVTLGDGLDAGLLGSVERTDGTVQATYGGWPLYYFVNDAAAGDVNGQGANDVWFVLDAAGEVVGA